MSRPRLPFAARLGGIYELEGGNAKRVLTMEGARGIAVALVFLVHYPAAFASWVRSGSWSDSVTQFLWTVGPAGVDFFFVLSGYLIYGAVLKPSLDYTKFIGRRIQRIYPAFLAVFALYLLLSYVFPSQSKIPAEPGAAAVYILQNLLLLPGLFPIQAIVSVAWSLSYEFFYYLALPALVLALRMQKWQPKQRVVFFSVLSVAFVISWYTLGAVAPRMLMFLGGILLYEAIHTLELWPKIRHRTEWLMIATTLIAFAAIGVVDADGRGDLPRIIVSFLAFPPLIFACFRASGPIYTSFSWTPLRWLGNMSYSYYLIHALTINAAAMFLGKLLPASLQSTGTYWLLMLPVFAATLVTSTLLFMLVEKPFSLVTTRHPRPLAQTLAGAA
ncbi:MAG TPA: acyltransferase [Thermoanaerobaculia bacterium]|nr:acyltransferase [Thermoanaerobaculia bacterium]